MAGRKPIALTLSTILDLIEKYDGNVTDIAKSLKVTRKTVYKYINENPEALEALDDARETFIDDVENALKKRIQAGDTTAIIFALKTRGKGRGYIEKVETQQSGTMEIVIKNADS